jgi:hypothetical protein
MFFYISLSLIFTYFTFVLIAYGSGFLKELYTLENCSLYYIFSYVILVAVMYMIDIGTRKEPAFLTLFYLPIISFVIVLVMMILVGISWLYYIVLIVIFGVFIALGFMCYNKWINRILMVKIGYENILFFYIIIHLFLVLFIIFKMLNLI